MGVCHSCLESFTSSPDDDDDPLADTLFLPQAEVDIAIPRTPLVTPQTPKERGLSKIVQQRPRRPSLAIQTRALETTPLLLAPPSPSHNRPTHNRTASTDSLVEEEESPLSPSLTYCDPFPDLDVGPFYLYAKEMSSRQAKNMFWLRSYWEVVCASLRPAGWVGEIDEGFITLRALVGILESGRPDDVLRYLAFLVEQDQILAGVAEEYLLKPLNGDFSGLLGIGETFVVPREDLESKSYSVCTFWTALHIILQTTLPPHRSLKEYLQIFMALQKCLSATLDNLRHSYTGYLPFQTPPTMSLLVFLPSNLPPELPELILPSVSIGFHLPDPIKETLLPSRRANLPLLTPLDQKQVEAVGERGLVGTSGLAETLAYTVSAPRGVAANKFRLILVNLTVSVMGGEIVPVKISEGERRLVEMLRDKYRVLVTLDLAPPYKRVGRF